MHLFVGKWRCTEWIVEPIMYVYIDTCMKLCIYIYIYIHIYHVCSIHIYIHDIIWIVRYDIMIFLAKQTMTFCTGRVVHKCRDFLFPDCTCKSVPSSTAMQTKKTHTLPETNSKSTWKWMVGRLSRFLLGSPIFRSKLLVSGSVQCKPLGTGVAISFWTK